MTVLPKDYHIIFLMRLGVSFVQFQSWLNYSTGVAYTHGCLLNPHTGQPVSCSSTVSGTDGITAAPKPLTSAPRCQWMNAITFMPLTGSNVFSVFPLVVGGLRYPFPPDFGPDACTQLLFRRGFGCAAARWVLMNVLLVVVTRVWSSLSGRFKDNPRSKKTAFL